MNGYDPEKYWHERGMHYEGKKEVEVEINHLRELIAADNLLHLTKILEVGSGYGRIYQATHPPLDDKATDYVMCDFVQSMRYHCQRNTGILPDYWDGSVLPYNDNEFDLVISFSVLLYVTPDKIEQVLKEHARVCRENIFIATYFGGLKRLAPHCFEHDYKALFKKLNLKIDDEQFFQNGLRANWLLSK